MGDANRLMANANEERVEPAEEIADANVAWLEEFAADSAVYGVPGADRFNSRLAEFVSGARFGWTLDEAFGVSATNGAFWKLRDRRKRNALLRELADRHFANLTTHAQAKAIGKAIRRYEASSWKHEKSFKSPPLAKRGLPEALYFSILKLGKALSDERIRKILGHEPPPSHAQPQKGVSSL